MPMAAPTPVIGEPRSRADLHNTEERMISWPDHRLPDLLEIELPIILAPMAGPGTAALAIAVAKAGGLGSLACVLLTPDQARAEFAAIRQGTSKHKHEFLLPCSAADDYITGSAGNAALMAFIKSLGGRSLHYGVRVVGINPGPVETDRHIYLMKTRARNELGDENRYGDLMKDFPLGRAARPREIADMTVFLASDRSA
jgi:NAD(P)-dependent dehydrogenase (short-subunit alcohol dehydrogenase family)